MRAKEFAKHIFEQIKRDWHIPVTEHQVYSTAETVVGVWTDGKPLYRIVVTGNIPTTTDGTNKETAIATINDIDTVISLTAMEVEGGDFNIPYPFGSTNNPSSGNIIYYRKNTKKIVVRTNMASLAGFPITVIMHYTKTTDTAASPKVPFEPLHEWSTNEKLIGYWIDGKPVYEKTVDCGALPNTSEKEVETGITGIDRVISISGYAYWENSYTIPIPVATNLQTQAVGVWMNHINNKLIIATGIDRSRYTECYVTLRYTKTTD